MTDPDEFSCNLFWRSDKVDATSSNRALGHTGKGGGFGILGQRHSPMRLDGCQSERTVSSCSRENDSDGALCMAICQRTLERINGQVLE